MIYYTISTGIGGGIIIEGRLHRGATGLAGEVGHVIVDPNGPPCPCGHRGCVEALCAGPAIARRALAALHAAGQRSTLLRHGVPLVELTAKDVADAARHGDNLAAQVWNDAIEDLAVGVGSAANVLNPDVIVFGGGVTRAGELFFPRLRTALERRVFPAALASLKIASAALGAHVGLYGAAALVR